MTTNEQDYIALRRLHDSTNETVQRLEAENAELKAVVELLEAQKLQWQQERIVQGQVIQDTLAKINATNSKYLMEIERLRRVLKEAKG